MIPRKDGSRQQLRRRAPERPRRPRLSRRRRRLRVLPSPRKPHPLPEVPPGPAPHRRPGPARRLPHGGRGRMLRCELAAAALPGADARAHCRPHRARRVPVPGDEQGRGQGGVRAGLQGVQAGGLLALVAEPCGEREAVGGDQELPGRGERLPEPHGGRRRQGGSAVLQDELVPHPGDVD